MTKTKYKALVYKVIVFLLLVLAESALAGNESIGVVVMHGKWGNPSGKTLDLAWKLGQEGFLVVSPAMPWSDTRLYDKGVDDAMAEIDAAVKTLRDKGAKKSLLPATAWARLPLYDTGPDRQPTVSLCWRPGIFRMVKAFATNWPVPSRKLKRWFKRERWTRGPGSTT